MDTWLAQSVEYATRDLGVEFKPHHWMQRLLKKIAKRTENDCSKGAVVGNGENSTVLSRYVVLDKYFFKR